VYPQTFYDSNGDGVGDLEGIIRKLDYIRSTGATAIWLNPFYVSPMRDAGYDVEDYYRVAPRYGSNEDAVRLFAEAKAKGLRVIVDFVPGHTSIDHAWFKESAKSNAVRPYRNWYIWTDSAWDDGGSPWNRKMIHGFGNRDGNFLINFFCNQPALNFGFGEPEPNKPWQLPTTHEDVQALWREMRKVLRFWLEMGVDGFRVDMADSIVRRDPDSKEARRFWRETREELGRDFPDLFLIAEGLPSNVLDGTGFHSAYLHWAPGYWQVFRGSEVQNQELGKMRGKAYFDRSGEGDFRPYLKTWSDEYERTRGRGVITVPVGNHDLPRVATGQPEEDLILIFAFQCAWPGIPFIYYGDEIGMRQQSSANPIHEGHYPTRNGARTPMQWDGSENCGFSSCQPHELYLPVDPAPRESTVEAQQSRRDSLLNRCRQLNELHRTVPAFAADAPIKIVSDGAPGEPLVFIRGEGAKRVLCFFQPAEGLNEFRLNDEMAGGLGKLMAKGFSELECAERVIRTRGPAWGFFQFES
jgi:maltose alpha-D-glucosyltransferase/alpha-amylase